MKRKEATQSILAAKQQKGVSFEEIARAVGRHKVWTTSALLGQATMTKEESALAQWALLGLSADVAEALQQIPLRGSLDETVPVDPLIYRFHEITQVYGTTIKALIHEIFGDGIMSADRLYHGHRARTRTLHGDRVKVTF